MAAVDQDMFGWELLYHLIENQLKTNLDVIISVTHWALTRRGFRCAGVGEDPVLPKLDTVSQLLPVGWNASTTYRLRYVYGNKLYLLSTIKNERMDEIIINLNRPADGQVSGITVKVNEVKNIRGTISELLPNYENIVSKMNTELIETLLKIEISREVQTQTPDNLTKEKSRPVRESLSSFELPTPPAFLEPGQVGTSDLHPFFDGGGGMLMEPPGMRPRGRIPHLIDPTLPRGAVPPGARFDPIRPFFGTPRPNQTRNPDHDHFPPPGYDDMFM